MPHWKIRTYWQQNNHEYHANNTIEAPTAALAPIRAIAAHVNNEQTRLLDAFAEPNKKTGMETHARRTTKEDA